MGRLSMGESLTGPKVPGREEAVNDGPKTALWPGPGNRLWRRQLGPRGRGGPAYATPRGYAHRAGERGNSLAGMG
jgi:hypothetical protein